MGFWKSMVTVLRLVLSLEDFFHEAEGLEKLVDCSFLKRVNEDNYEPGLYVSDVLPYHGSNLPCVIRAVLPKNKGSSDVARVVVIWFVDSF
ncbi:predicted protein [Lichtheimia corymbifera JMRC:FSU:9682]|uniref:Uncharacterized protein n=1 Tax=Lichtheimia corymbifera JMRC:FSU:9682 TaxID=1263082 RepID=A0A068SBX8_9FUNG|nr:predicted protein [Lichtheimia corymbifera JMRC:FSU:9682]